MILSVMDFMYGNLCQDKLTGELLEVTQIGNGKQGYKDYLGFHVLNRSNYPLPDGWQAQPILLNAETLIRFNILTAYNWLMNILCDDTDYYCGFEFLHQFQNAYQLLTGQTLKLKI